MNFEKQPSPTYLSKASGPLPFCPGCGHRILIKALDKAMVKLRLDPHKTVVVTDIGCIGLSDRYFTTNAFHGLHGRSITYGCGLKLSRPELTVIVLQGDGGCGIGGAHLLNAARRNIGITLIVGNNFNYGMTGGQHSITTPQDGITSTTPLGNVERPIDLCKTVAAAGGAWAFRATTFDRELSDIFFNAIKQPGFSMVDTWEPCTAYYSVKNRINKKEFVSILGSLGFKTGLLFDNPRPEFTEQYRKKYKRTKQAIKIDPAIRTEYRNSLKNQTGFIIAGSAGQKIKSTATLFAQASMFCGLNATQKDDYPITVMTGPSIAEIILSPQRIDYTAIESPDYLVVTSEDGLKRVRRKIENLSNRCFIITDNSINLPKTKAKIIKIPINKTAQNIHKLSITVLALAFLIEKTGMFPIYAFESAINTFQKPDIAEKNLKALDAGIALASEIGKI
ncbi:MAG: thiamine pyrophosphate-dependent enzyme [Chitinispirillia bacterium]|jgi:pyruvate/2-oxoacid:ferredoxin oxidoreductase beta subunit